MPSYATKKSLNTNDNCNSNVVLFSHHDKIHSLTNVKYFRKIDMFRKQRFLSWKELAEIMDTHHSYINQLKTGRRPMSVEWLERFAKALKCYMTDLLPSEFQRPIEIDEAVFTKTVGMVLEELKDKNLKLPPELIAKLLLGNYMQNLEHERKNSMKEDDTSKSIMQTFYSCKHPNSKH